MPVSKDAEQSRDPTISLQFSDKLEAYDDKATALGHPRKDQNAFIWLYFVYTFTTITMKTYTYCTTNLETEATNTIFSTFVYIVPIVCGTSCVFLTGIFLDLIRQRFRHLNKTIVPHVSPLPMTGSQGEITVYDVRYLHGVLIDGATFVDTVYGLGSLIVFVSILLEFVSVIYMLITGGEDNAVITMVDLLFQVVYLFAMYHVTTYEVRARRAANFCVATSTISEFHRIPGESRGGACREIRFAIRKRKVSLGESWYTIHGTAD